MSFPNLLFNTESLLNTAGTSDSKTGVSSGTKEPAVLQKNIFYMMTKEQAEKSGMLDEFLRVDTDGSGEISQTELFDFKKSSKSSIDTSAMAKNLSSMTSEEQVEYIIKQEMSKHIDMSKADEKFNGMNIKQALQEIGITKELLEANGLTCEQIKENPEELSKLLYKQLDEKYQNDISNKDGETWQNEYQRLKNGEFTDFEKRELGLSCELTEKQLEVYTKFAIGQKYAATAKALIETAKNTTNEEEMAYLAGLVQGLEDSFFENDVKAILATLGITEMAQSKNIYTEQTASKIAENAEAYGIFEGDEEISVLATAVIVQTASPESIEKFILSNPEHADLIKQVAENVISSMPDGARKEALQKTLNSAIAKVEAETKTSSSNGTKTTVAASTDNNPQNITKSQILPPPPDNITSAPVTDPINEQTTPTTVSVSSLQVKKSVPEIYINSLNGVADDIEKFKNSTLKDGLEYLVELFNDPKSNNDVQTKIKYFFGSLKPAYRAEMYATGSRQIHDFIDGQGFTTLDEVSKYFSGKPEELDKFKDTYPSTYKNIIAYMDKHDAAGKGNNYDNFNPL